MSDTTLSFATEIDVTGLENGLNQVEAKISGVTAEVKTQSEKISDALKNVPNVNIEFITNASQSLSTIDAAFKQIDEVVDSNKASIRELQDAYNQLSTQSSMEASGGSDVSELEAQKQAIAENIALREEIIAEATKQADALAQTEAKLKAEAEAMKGAGDSVAAQLAKMSAACQQNEAALDKLEAEYKVTTASMANALKSGSDAEYNALKQKQTAIAQEIASRKQQVSEIRSQMQAMQQTTASTEQNSTATEQNANKQQSLRSRMRELREEMANYRMQFGDQTEEYRAMATELGNLQDIQGDIVTQGSVLSNDQAQFQGIISGLSGVAGGYTAVSGAMALFGTENEEMAAIMQKVQSLMAITMGLQQLSQTLNKDSAFQLATINGLRQYWNKIVAAATGTTTANTAAETANAAARQRNAAAAGQESAAISADSKSKGVNTATSIAGTTANLSLAGAFRAVGAAIKGIPVFGWIAAGITALIGVISAMVGKANEFVEATEEMNNAMRSGRENYAAAGIEIDDYKRKIENFNGTQGQETALVKELNNKYGEEIGFCKTLSEWKQKLIEKGDNYCKSLLKQAEAEVLLKKYQEAIVKKQEAETTAAAYEENYDTTAFWMGDYYAENKKKQNAEAVKAAEEEIKAAEDAYIKAQKEYEQFKADNQIGGFIDPESTKTKTTTKSAEKTYDAELAAIKTQQAQQKYNDAVAKYAAEAETQIAASELAAQKDGLAKELAQIDASTKSKIAAWEKQITELAKVRQQADKDVFLQQEGKTEADWAKSEQGQKTVGEYVLEIKADETTGQAAEKMLEQIHEDAERQKQEITKRYNAELVEQYGSTDEKIALKKQEWVEKMAGLDGDYLQRATEQMNAEIAAIQFDAFKLEIDWSGIFGNLSEKSLPQLQNSLKQLETYYNESVGNLSVDEIKEIEEAMDKLEKEIGSRNPFLAFRNSIADLASSKSEFQAACQAQADAIREVEAARQEQADAEAELADLDAQAETDDTVKNSEKYAEAEARVAAAKQKTTEAEKANEQATTQVLDKRQQVINNLSELNSSFKAASTFAAGFNDKISGLAAAFGKELGNGMSKALDTCDEVFDAADGVIQAFSNIAGGVVKGIDNTVDATVQGMEATAIAGAQTMSTIEKASVILAIIQAALQVAMAIANLFNNDDDLQEKIEDLQNNIDNLQWQLDNVEAVTLMENYGSAVDNVKAITDGCVQSFYAMQNSWKQMGVSSMDTASIVVDNADLMAKAVDQIVESYASLDYAASQTLGTDKYDASSTLENYAAQLVNLQAQIETEDDKKKTNYDQIEEWEQEMEEIAAEMASVISDMMDDIIGYTASDLSATLTDAFVDACANGEDAMEAWGDTAKDVVIDAVKNLLSAQLEEKMAALYTKYEKVWFNKDGTYNAQATIDSMVQFAEDVTEMGESFTAIYESMSDALQDYIEETTRTADSGGIATASQESVDENNARLTTIQGHTYQINQGLTELNTHVSAMQTTLNNIYTQQTTMSKYCSSMNNLLARVCTIWNTVSQTGLKVK